MKITQKFLKKALLNAIDDKKVKALIQSGYQYDEFDLDLSPTTVDENDGYLHIEQMVRITISHHVEDISLTINCQLELISFVD